MIIRRASLSDLDNYKAIHNSYFVLRYNCMNKLSDSEALEQLQMDINNDKCFIIDIDGCMVGAIYFGKDTMRYGVKGYNLSYFLSEKYSNKGVMTKALNMALEIIFKEDIDYISARVFSDNKASISLLKKLGFKQEGYLKYAVKGYEDIIYDDTLWVMFKEEYMSVRKGE